MSSRPRVQRNPAWARTNTDDQGTLRFDGDAGCDIVIETEQRPEEQGKQKEAALPDNWLTCHDAPRNDEHLKTGGEKVGGLMSLHVLARWVTFVWMLHASGLQSRISQRHAFLSQSLTQLPEQDVMEWRSWLDSMGADLIPLEEEDVEDEADQAPAVVPLDKSVEDLTARRLKHQEDVGEGEGAAEPDADNEADDSEEDRLELSLIHI